MSGFLAILRCPFPALSLNTRCLLQTLPKSQVFPQLPPEKYQKPKRLSSRVLVKHILRVRAQAARELAELLLELENGEEVVAQTWLAEEFGGKVLQQSQQDGVEEQLTGWVKQGGREAVGRLYSI